MLPINSRACGECLKAATGVEVILYACTDSIINAFTANSTALRLYIADTRYGDTAPGENGKTELWCGFQYSWKGDIGGVMVDLDEFTPDMIIPEYTYGVPAPAPPRNPHRYRLTRQSSTRSVSSTP